MAGLILYVVALAVIGAAVLSSPTPPTAFQAYSLGSIFGALVGMAFVQLLHSKPRGK